MPSLYPSLKPCLLPDVRSTSSASVPGASTLVCSATFDPPHVPPQVARGPRLSRAAYAALFDPPIDRPRTGWPRFPSEGGGAAFIECIGDAAIFQCTYRCSQRRTHQRQHHPYHRACWQLLRGHQRHRRRCTHRFSQRYMHRLPLRCSRRHHCARRLPSHHLSCCPKLRRRLLVCKRPSRCSR